MGGQTMPGNDELLREWLSATRSCGEDQTRASMIVQLCKSFDLTNPANHFAVDEISQWIASPSADVRRAVVFALCALKPVQGCEWLLAEGWSRAPVGDLHWYASAIENSCSSIEHVSQELVCAVASTLLTAPPTQPEDPRSLDALEAWQDYRIARSESARALRHLAIVVLPEHAWRPDAEVDWECVARLLHRSYCRHTAAVATQIKA
jgi:hypothetical protein